MLQASFQSDSLHGGERPSFDSLLILADDKAKLRGLHRHQSQRKSASSSQSIARLLPRFLESARRSGEAGCW